jgi:ribulose-phosphate 3-epimerase
MNANTVKIAPSLLSADFGRLKEEISQIENAGADLLHLDVMDGHFVPNLTFGMPVIQAIKKYSKLPLDVHLMVTNPDFYIDHLANIGVDYISFHVETEYHINRLLNKIKEKNIKSGIVLNPATNWNQIEYVADIMDFILLMTVNPGFGGQSFILNCLEKIRIISKYKTIRKLNFEIEVDGGVTDQNASNLINAGADILVAGSYIFNSNNYAQQIRSLKLCSQNCLTD